MGDGKHVTKSLTDVTINMLKDKLRDYEEDMASTVEVTMCCYCSYLTVYDQAQVKEKERQLQRDFNEQQRLQQDLELETVTKLGQAEQQAGVLQAALVSGIDGSTQSN